MRLQTDLIEKALDLLQQARNAEAEALLKEALKVDVDNADALHALSVIRYQAGDKAGAEMQLRALIVRHPSRIPAQYDLACMMIEQARDAEALALLQGVLDALPDHANAWYQKGFVLKMQLRMAEAEEALLTCLRLAPAHAAAANDLARIFRDRGDYPGALEVFERAAAAAPPESALYQAWWQFLSLSALPVKGLEIVQHGVDELPMDVDLRLGLAQALEGEGDRQRAEQQYRIALRLDGNRGFAVGNLLALIGAAAEPQLIRQGEQLLQDPGVRASARALIGYGLGKVRHAKGESADAMRCWHIANQARKVEAGRLDRVALEAQISQTLSAFKPDAVRRLAAEGNSEQQPLLIVGMPRSGTTLVEQIIASHGDVEGLGELPDLPIISENFCRAHGAAALWPDCTEMVNAERIRRSAEHYLKVLRFRAEKSSVARLIDKAPLNFFNLGLFALMFPRARVIWCRRDPRDVCLSIYTENFAPNQKYATDLEDLAYYYRQHERLMVAWQSFLPCAIHEVAYRELVQDQEFQTRRLIEFVGLDWDPRCLQFHSSERSVQTPSRWQVRQPMYSSSLSRWKRYEPWLGALTREFGSAENAV